MAKSHLKTVFGSGVIALAMSISGIFGVAPVSASEKPIYLWVSPASQNIGNLDPGSTYSGKFTVQNSGTESFHYKVYASPYYVKDNENGDYSPEYSNSNKYTYISEWFTFSKETGYLESGKNEEIEFTVKVPNDVAGGAQNAAIMVETEDTADGVSTVQSTARVGSIVYSTVNGETNYCGNIIDKNIPTLLINPPITASGKVENCGNVDLNVRYIMTVTPLFSNEPIYSNEEDPMVYATLPETKRYSSLKWDGTPAFGIFNVKLDITYNEKTETIEKMVIVCPLWLIVLIILFIGAVIFWLVSRNRERKAKKLVEE
ncbi:MAG: LapA family protein [Candidatus Saccharibacteria bacterium]|nr:LapA family protein [Candidatus Saccharibacteria bacterium]MDO4967742.1 LapA family protein [Candidatus Saccharibacteria bacterium]